MDLSTYRSLQTNLFVKLTLTDPLGGDQIITFSDYHRTLTIDSVDYVGLGSFLSITATSSDLRVTAQELTIGISGIPEQNIADFLTQESRGGLIQVQRGAFDPVTGNLLPIANNPSGRFRGIINSFGISEDYDAAGKTSTMTIILNCASQVTQLLNRVAGRSTNPWSQRDLYPSDASFDRVPNIAGANYNFGAP